MSEPQPERWEALAEAHGLATADPDGVASWAADLRQTLSTRALEWFDQLFQGGGAFSALADAMALLPWAMAAGAVVVVALALLRVRRLLDGGRRRTEAPPEEEALAPVARAADHRAQLLAALEAGHVEVAIETCWAWTRAQLSEQGWGALSDELTHGEVVRAVRRAGAGAETIGPLSELARAMDVWRYGGQAVALEDARRALTLAERVVA